MIENCPGPEELTGIVIPECKIPDEAEVSSPARLLDTNTPSLRDRLAAAWASDYLVGPIPILKLGAAVAGGILGWILGA